MISFNIMIQISIFIDLENLLIDEWTVSVDEILRYYQ